jgi:hypothetical protein
VKGWTTKKIAFLVFAAAAFLFYVVQAGKKLGLIAGVFFGVLGVAIFLFEVRRLRTK